MINPFAKKLVRFLQPLLWWSFLLICLLYGVYAFSMGFVEILAQLGVVNNAPQRATPIIFLIHAFAGGVALISGAFQLNGRILNKNRALHRRLGRVYVGAIWLASIGSMWMILFFDVSGAAKIVFGLLALLWFGTTTIGLFHIRRRKIAQHRAWMIRSFSLSFFFVTFSLWAPGLTAQTCRTQ